MIAFKNLCSFFSLAASKLAAASNNLSNLSIIDLSPYRNLWFY
ncbi:Uncharacterised protein [Vibrio cholerae]|nr:Uncharacterised protein [Vibrio cholerae]